MPSLEYEVPSKFGWRSKRCQVWKNHKFEKIFEMTVYSIWAFFGVLI
jgi:hypothetical protein